MNLNFSLQCSLVLLLLVTKSEVYGLSLKPPSEEIFSSQLCPDPTTTSKAIDRSSLVTSGLVVPVDILSVNLDKPKEPPTHFYEGCNFRGVPSSEPKSLFDNGTNVKVRSINLNVNPWNFSKADNCSNFIKFNNWDDRDSGKYPVLCGRENFDQYLGPYGHPMVLYYQWKSGYLSFPLFHSSYGPNHRDRKDTLDLNFLQIYFAVYTKNGLRCRVQQYNLDLLRLGCSAISSDDEPICGEYHCPDLETLYQTKMTIFKNGEADNDTVLVWKAKQDKYRMRTFLRQKFVPVLFLVVLILAYRSYMKAGMRFRNSLEGEIPEFRTRSIRLRRNYPAATRAYSNNDVPDPDPFWDFDTDEDPPPYLDPRARSSTNPNTAVNIPTLNQSQRPGVGPGHRGAPVIKPDEPPHPPDPPPSYDSVCPPTYYEATKP